MRGRMLSDEALEKTVADYLTRVRKAFVTTPGAYVPRPWPHDVLLTVEDHGALCHELLLRRKAVRDLRGAIEKALPALRGLPGLDSSARMAVALVIEALGDVDHEAYASLRKEGYKP